MNYIKIIATAMIAGVVACNADAVIGKFDDGCTQTVAENLPAISAENVAGLAEKAKAWIDDMEYDAGHGISVELRNDGTEAYLHGTIGRFNSIYDSYRMVLALNPTNSGMAVCYGVLPVHVPESKRTAVAEFLFRAEKKLALSPATLVLDEACGNVIAQAAFPMAALYVAPRDAVEMLVESVALRLIACSRGLQCVVAHDLPPEEVMPLVNDFHFNLSQHSPKMNEPHDREIVMSGLARIGNPGQFEFDTMDRVAYSICAFPDIVPEDRRAEVGRFIMFMNSNMRYGLFSMDWDAGTISCRHATPVFLFNKQFSETWTADGMSNALCFASAKVERHSDVMAAAIAGRNLLRDEKFKSEALRCGGRDIGSDVDGASTHVAFEITDRQDNCNDSLEARQESEDRFERCLKAAEAGDVEALEELGWAYYDGNGVAEDKLEAAKWWCKAGARLSDLTKALLRLNWNNGDRCLFEMALDVVSATGGRPLPASSDPIAFRFELAKTEYVARKTGFWEDPTWPPFPALVAVTNATGLNLDFSRRLEESVNGKLAQFPDGEIRWTEDGTNGLSFAETSARMNAAHIEVAKEMMRDLGKTPQKTSDDNSLGSWILNDDFTFGYLTLHRENGRDSVYYAFTLRHEMNGTPAKTCVLAGFAPTQLMSDSIMGAFAGDKAAKANFDAMKDIGIVAIFE